MVECDFMENIKDHEWVAKTVYYKKKGDKVVCMAVSPASTVQIMHGCH